jgi:glycosyltransferase involved in cell wall biosynthesis
MVDLISIIIPAYNAERFIARTLSSALNQTFRDIEVIVVNDGSSDKTQVIVEGFAVNDCRVRLVNTMNRGVATARNLGIENARGNYVAFLDADDLWHPTKLERQFLALSSHASDPTWAGVYVLSRVIDEDDLVVGAGEAKTRCRGYVLAHNFVLRFVGNGSNLLVRREAALAVGGFDPSYAEAGLGGCEDFDFELKLAAKYRIEAVQMFLVGYRFYEGNMSSDRVRMARSLVATIERHIERNPSLPPRILRWGVGNGHRYAFDMLRWARKYRPALRAYWMIVVNDPILSIDVAVTELAMIIKRRLISLLPTAGTSQAFLYMDPEAGLNSRIATITRIRQRQLAAADRAIEAKIFLSASAGTRVHDSGRQESTLSS